MKISLSKELIEIANKIKHLELELQSAKKVKRDSSAEEEKHLTSILEAAKIVIDKDGNKESILLLHKALVAGEVL